MPAPVVVMLGAAALRVVSKKVLDLLVKRGAKKLTQKQVNKLKSPPKNVTVSNVANVLRQTRVAKPPQPRVNPGTPRPPAARSTSAPAAPRTAPKSPTANKPGNSPKVPAATTRPRPGTSVAQPKSPRSGSNSSGGPRPMRDITPNKNAPGRPSGDRIVGMNPKAIRNPTTKLGALDTATPEVVVAPSDDKKPVVNKPPLKKTTKKQSDANKKAAETKKNAPVVNKPPLETTTKKQGDANKKAAEAKKNAPTQTAPKKSLRPKQRPAAGPVTDESFGKAFARNRKSGNGTFTWKDKKYTTRYKEETIAEHKKKFGVEGKY